MTADGVEVMSVEQAFRSRPGLFFHPVLADADFLSHVLAGLLSWALHRATREPRPGGLRAMFSITGDLASPSQTIRSSRSIRSMPRVLMATNRSSGRSGLSWPPVEFASIELHGARCCEDSPMTGFVEIHDARNPNHSVVTALR